MRLVRGRWDPDAASNFSSKAATLFTCRSVRPATGRRSRMLDLGGIADAYSFQPTSVSRTRPASLGPGTDVAGGNDRAIRSSRWVIEDARRARRRRAGTGEAATVRRAKASSMGPTRRRSRSKIGELLVEPTDRAGGTPVVAVMHRLDRLVSAAATYAATVSELIDLAVRYRPLL